ncbi:aldo/keto reductase [Conexibacter stalactiti]|uniref:Aldo/keto reductase n=1 Tax=Conexibacter stalactiti TaxID=1940611 RepID=A0ABU4HXR6_9ACTN|nr:aldo/keto reductase [Conexibacter stalactiti]MDW5598103.1 aldo/keto reductase [Conexibacter stalactiti]MEC5038745.1 aldo/keto reductase [Conexibacter stalactiti]
MTDQRSFGRTGLSVSSLTLGTMMFGRWGNPDHDDAVRIIHAALDAGINVIDTADVYAAGESEQIVAKALAGGRRDDVVLATKFHGSMGDDPNRRGNSRRWIFRAVEESLRRLQTDWIDLYQVHRYDPGTDVEETLGALDDLVRAGKIRYAGSSTWPLQRVVEAQWSARRDHRTRFVSEQPPYSILVRRIEGDLLPAALDYGLAVLPWSPLAGGWLSGRWRLGQEAPSSPRSARVPDRYNLELPANRRKLEAADALARLAEEAGLTLIQLALAWALRHPAVTSLIIGPRTMEQLQSQLGADAIVLSDDVLDRIDEIVPPGTTVNPADDGWTNPALAPAARRRGA